MQMTRLLTNKRSPLKQQKYNGEAYRTHTSTSTICKKKNKKLRQKAKPKATTKN